MHACLDLTCITELTQSSSLMHDQKRFHYLVIQVWKRVQHFLNRDFHFVIAQEKKPGAESADDLESDYTVEPEI